MTVGIAAIRADKAFVDGSFRAAVLGVSSEPTIHLDDNYVVFPGLINAHDHLQFNSFPLFGGSAKYGDMYEWAAAMEAERNSTETRAALKIPFEDRLRIGGLKNLLSGATTVAHHDAYSACFERRFPVRVVRNYEWSHSLGLDTASASTFRRTAPSTPWIIHAAEGLSERASREIDAMDEIGLLKSNTVLVHALAATPNQLRVLRERRCSIIVCPVSNQFLYGRTLDFAALPQGLRLALGSDSAVTSSSGILDDLGTLRSICNWSEEQLWSLVTSAPTDILQLPTYPRDFVALREGEPELVVIDGEVHLSGRRLRHLFAEEPQRLRVRGQEKFISARIQVPWRSLARAAEWTPYLRDIAV